jgi:hypothetical protein
LADRVRAVEEGIMRILAAGVLMVLGGTATAFAQLLPPVLPTPPPPAPPLLTVPVPLTVSGNEATATVDLPGGIGFDLTLQFETVVGLTPSALDASASLVNPLDPALLSRLRALGNLSVPASFPVLVRIAPSASSALSFAGVYTLSLHTHNLQLNPLLPLSLVKSPDGGAFRDITNWEGRGSYRDDGSGGDFSEFLIAVDLRSIDAVIDGKFADVQALLNEHAASIDPTVLATLQAQLDLARMHYQSGDLLNAIRDMREFSRIVKAYSGEEIPDVWRANCPTVPNVAGFLRSAADTLKFSLDRKSTP